MLATPQLGLRRRVAGSALVLAATSALAYGAWAQQPQRIETPIATADAGAADTGVPAEVRNRKLTLKVVEMPVEAVARRVAGELGLTFQGPMPDGGRKVTMDFRDVSAASVLQILAEETGSEAQVTAGSLRFLMRAPTGAAQPRTNRAAEVDIRTKNANPPRYPAVAFEAGQTGKVVLLVDVAADGSVADVQVETSQPKGVFDQATLDAARQWRFEPAMKDGKPVAGRIRVPVTFEMDPDDAGQAAPGSDKATARSTTAAVTRKDELLLGGKPGSPVVVGDGAEFKGAPTLTGDWEPRDPAQPDTHSWTVR